MGGLARVVRRFGAVVRYVMVCVMRRCAVPCAGSLPALLDSLAALAYLDLSANDITGTLPVEYTQLTALTFLALDHQSWVLQGGCAGVQCCAGGQCRAGRNHDI